MGTAQEHSCGKGFRNREQPCGVSSGRDDPDMSMRLDFIDSERGMTMPYLRSTRSKVLSSRKWSFATILLNSFPLDR